jgi:hypothetical protein
VLLAASFGPRKTQTVELENALEVREQHSRSFCDILRGKEIRQCGSGEASGRRGPGVGEEWDDRYRCHCGGVALPAELLTLDAAPLDRLEEMT